MRLKDAIKKIEKEQPSRTIKIGTQRGSGFIFVGTIHEYWKNDDRFQSITRKCAEDAYRAAKAIAEKRKIKLSELAKDAKKAAEEVKKAASEAEKAKEAEQAAKERLCAYVPPDEREVIEVFEACKVVDDAMIIMVTGYESGRLWDTSERKKRSPWDPVAI